ncbi:hypothetical protein FNV43_RR22281 [Rhamnella rubrinervis]|uniref:Uncharacterized protein n=1 Tax=Rhamnella rubrinervis TaxID=2594499 RepID=A0A8K0DVV0_9ROSA|nr:hypothetical protein FNV43_RR22281 [Rhamnella rubrinervis]
MKAWILMSQQKISLGKDSAKSSTCCIGHHWNSLVKYSFVKQMLLILRGGYSSLKVVESFRNPPDNKEKPVAPLPASLSPSLLDSKKLKAVSRVSEIGPTGKFQPQVLYLIELGMDLDQIKHATRRFPSFICYSLEGKIKPLVEFLLDLGVSKSDVCSILFRRPRLCGYSLSEKILPTMSFLEGLGADKKQWAKLIYLFPGFVTYSRQKVKTTVDFLYEMGLSEENIGKLLTRCPNIISFSVEDKLRPTAEYFLSLGVDVAVLLHRAPHSFVCSLDTNLTENLMPKWEFFLNMDYPRSELVKFPQYFGYRLEERIKPRLDTLPALLSPALEMTHWTKHNEAVQRLRMGLWTQLAFLSKVFFCQGKANFAPSVENVNQRVSDIFTADSGESGSFSLKAVERFPNPPNNKEKPVAVLTASLSPSLIDSKKLKASSRVSEIGSFGKLRPQVLYLIELGLDLEQIKDITRRFPAFAFYSLEGKIKPLVEFLLDIGVPKSDIPSILSRTPQLCGLSLSEKIIPRVAFLESLGVNRKQRAKVIHRFPAFLTNSRQKVKSAVDFLYEMGLSAESIGKILTRCPNIVSCSVEDKLRPTAEYFRLLGVDIAFLLRRFPQNLSYSIEANIKPVTEFFLERGYSMEEVGTMISRFASLYGLSLAKNLLPKWEFFLTMDYPRSELVKIPAYFGYSLEGRIKPRYALMKEYTTNAALTDQMQTIAIFSLLRFPILNTTTYERLKGIFIAYKFEVSALKRTYWTKQNEAVQRLRRTLVVYWHQLAMRGLKRRGICGGEVVSQLLDFRPLYALMKECGVVLPLTKLLALSSEDLDKALKDLDKALKKTPKKSTTTQRLAFLGKVFFCQANVVEFGTKVVESFSNPPDNKEKKVAQLPATLSPTLLNSKRLKAMSRVSEISPTGELRPQVLYLIELGMDLDQIKSMARRHPAFAFYSLEGKIKPLVEFLLDLGVPKSDIPSILSRTPRLCSYSLSGNLIHSVAFLESLGVDRKQWGKVICRFPAFITCSRQKVKTTVGFLYEMGLSEESIGKVLTRCPKFVSLNVKDKLRSIAEYFRSLGVDVAVLLYRYPENFGLSLENNLKPVTEFFLEIGYSREEVGTMISRFGAIYMYSLEENLKPKWDFFLTMDYPQSELVKFPQYFSYSLEHRIKPRYVLMKECGELHLQTRDISSLLCRKQASIHLQGVLPVCLFCVHAISFSKTQSAFLLFCQANFDVFTADSGISRYSALKGVESCPNPPDNKEKPVAPLPASLASSLLDSERLKAISRVSEMSSSGKLWPQVLYFIELGIDLDQIKRITKIFPRFPFYSLEGKIKPLVKFLLDLGVPKSGIPSILIRRPQLCGISLSGNLIPNMTFLESLGVDKKQWAKVIYRCPAFVTCSRHKVKTTIDFLYEMGLSENSIGKILTQCPNIVCYNVEDKLRPIAEYFRLLGVDVAVLFRKSPSILGSSLETNLKPVTEFFFQKGYNMEEVGTMISRFGALYLYSLEENLKPKWEFFLTMDYPKSELVKFPPYFGYSLEQRIKPSYSLEQRVKPRFRLLKECGVVLPLSSLLLLSSHDFDKALKRKLKENLADQDQSYSGQSNIGQ